jgi:hypothetical protein
MPTTIQDTNQYPQYNDGPSRRFEVTAGGRRYEVQAPDVNAAADAVRTMIGQTNQPQANQPGGASQRIQAPDGSIIEFPAGMSDDEISAVMRREFGGPDASQSRIDGAFQAGSEEPAQPPSAPTVGRGRAFLEGVADAATFGFGDEIGAALDLSPSALFGPNAWGEYQQNLERRRQSLQGAQEQRPGYSIAGGVGGAVLTAPMLPIGNVARGAGMGARTLAGIKSGAAYGGGYGLGSGEGLFDRAGGAVEGAAYGAGAGAAAPLAVRGVQAAGRGARKAGGNIAAQFRGAFAPEREARRTLGMAQRADDFLPQDRLTAADEALAVQHGQPVLNIDRGGETVRGAARAAANLSPPGRALMQQTISDRYASQGDRTIDAIRRIVGGATTTDNRQILYRQARAANEPAYLRAYNAPGAQAMWDEGFEQMASAPVVQDAIRKVTITSRNRAALEGYRPPLANPFHVDRTTGMLSLKQLPDGGVMKPSLEFWDKVKQNLDSVGTREARDFARVLREHLDDLVPEYRSARGGAAQFFGANDALEAGEQFVASRMGNDEARIAIQKMNAAEKTLFAEGFADSLVRRISEVSNRRDVIDSAFIRTRASVERIELALGPRKARELEAFLRVEDLMDRARDAFGNSTSIRQYVELGLIGTGSGAAYGGMTGDWGSAAMVGLGAAAARSGGRAASNRIRTNVARHVAKMLVSKDPAVMQRGLRMVANNGKWMNALRAADLPAALGASRAVQDAQPPLRVYLNAGERDEMMGPPSMSASRRHGAPSSLSPGEIR